VDGAQQPLLAGYEVQVCNSLQVLRLTLDNATAAPSELDIAAEALVVGYPDVDLPAVRLPWAPEDIAVEKLPGAAAEATAVAEALGASALVGAAATREAVLRRLQSAPVVHIATHGFVNEGSDSKTVLLLHDDHLGGGSSSAASFLSEDELDPATLPLAARLVVLPACHSGRGDDRWTGEGLVGLGRALLACGAPTVVLSLWSLPDETANDMMVEFYRLLADPSVGGGQMQGDTSALLRAAVLKQFPGSALKRRWVDWAALQVLGAGLIRLPAPPVQASLMLSIEEFLEHGGKEPLPQYTAQLAHLNLLAFDDAALVAAGVRKMFHRKRLLRWQAQLRAEQAAAVPQSVAEQLNVLVLNTTEDDAQDEADLLGTLFEEYSTVLHPIFEKFPGHVRMVTSWERTLLVLEQLPPQPGAVLCLCGFGVDVPATAMLAGVLAAVQRCQPQCVLLSGGGASSLKAGLENAGVVPTVHCWGADVSVDDRQQLLKATMRQLLEAKVLQLEAAKTGADKGGRYIPKQVAKQWTADKVGRLVAATGYSEQQASEALQVCDGNEGQAEAMLKGGATGPAITRQRLLRTESVHEAMRQTRIMLSFAAADGGFHLARDLRALLLDKIAGWATDEPGNPAQEAYLDFFNLAFKPGTYTLPDGTYRNDHWSEFYLMGTLCAHTVVLIIDDEFEASPFCVGELDGFVENCHRARDFKREATGHEPKREPEPEDETRLEGRRFPGSEFELAVVYEQSKSAGEEGQAKIDALRAKFEAVIPRCSFFPAWFSCFGPAAIVNTEATAAVEGLRPAWETYAGQTAPQKVDRKTRVDPPRIPLEFRPFGIVGQGCAKGDGHHGVGQTCAACEAERQRFVREVQIAETRFGQTAVARVQDYCTLYNHRWRAKAHELQGGSGGSAVAKPEQKSDSADAEAAATAGGLEIFSQRLIVDSLLERSK
jgi:hypothetical protein